VADISRSEISFEFVEKGAEICAKERSCFGQRRLVMNLIPLLGSFEIKDSTVVFNGGTAADPTGRNLLQVGNLLSDQFFGGGTLRATVEFSEVSDSACGLILFYQPLNQSFIEAQLGGPGFVSVWTFVNSQWTEHGRAGMGSQIVPGREYKLRVNARGSSVSMWVDDVQLLATALPFPLPRGQAGIWCRSKETITITDFHVEARHPTAFAIMQFSAPYNELYTEVVRPVSEQFGLTCLRADESFGPGVIIQDIERQILEAQVVIADITPANSNVYYEVGYAHALQKPTILIAEKATDLPFDVSPFRVLFYENSIAGKAKVEAGLRNHLRAILESGGLVAT
jgi:hypothetical protein